MNVLVVYYSRTGNTRKLAQRIAFAMNAEIDEISDVANRKGIAGYLRSGNEAWFRRAAKIHPSSTRARDFDLVVIGTPVWRVSLSSPVRSYLEEHAPHFRRVAFFCTMDRFGSGRVFRQMQEACDKQPVATFAQTARQLRSGDLPAAVAAFAEKLGVSAGSRPRMKA